MSHAEKPKRSLMDSTLPVELPEDLVLFLPQLEFEVHIRKLLAALLFCAKLTGFFWHALAPTPTNFCSEQEHTTIDTTITLISKIIASLSLLQYVIIDICIVLTLLIFLQS